MKTKDDEYQDFKTKECREFRILGKAQVVCFSLMAACLLLFMWLDVITVIKVELTLLAAASIIAVIYNYLDSFYKKLFDEEYNKQNRSHEN